jgi:hypothetical protein
MGKFLEVYGVLIIAFIGFGQFWVKVLWDKYLRKGKIDYYETGTILIGYSPEGPTIGLNGTLRAMNRDTFIRSIDLLVVREKDKAQHIFKWIAFQSPKTDISGNQPALMEIPSSFMISPNSAHRFSIIFNDNDLFKDIKPPFSEYYSTWYKTTEELNRIWPPFASVLPEFKIIQQRASVIDHFRKSSITTDLFSALNSKCYWEQGDYLLTINITTSKPNMIFNSRYGFSLSEADSKNLKLNVIAILEAPISNYLKVSQPYYNFAFAEYHPFKENT